MHRIGAIALLLFPILGARESAQAQTPIRDDARAYSGATGDRAYIAARCAALYSEMGLFLLDSDSATANAKVSEAKEFLKRVIPPSQDVFFDWSPRYRAAFARQEDPATSLFGKDYIACGGILALIRDGDRMDRYSHAALRYLMRG